MRTTSAHSNFQVENVTSYAVKHALFSPQTVIEVEIVTG